MFTSPVVAVLLTICVLAICAVAYVLQQRFLNKEHSGRSKTNQSSMFLTAREQFLADLNALRDKLPVDSEDLLKTLHWLRDAAEIGIVTQNNVRCKIMLENKHLPKIVLTKTVDEYLYVAKFRFGSYENKEPYAWIVIEGSGIYISADTSAMDVLRLFAVYGKTELFDKQQQIETSKVQA